MRTSFVANLVIGGLMLTASAGSILLTPTEFLSHRRPALQLGQVVPKAFGRWREEQQMVGAVVNPETQAMLQKIYTQTLSRTYVNSEGQRVMLSLAYGADQRDGMQVHYPEVCYPAQGFHLGAVREDTLDTGFGSIPVKRLETSLSGQRFEPVTYWTTVGDVAVRGGVNKKLAEVRYSLDGVIADGLLFRVSTIDRDAAAGFAVQDAFVRELMPALQPDVRLRLAGLLMARP